MKYTLLLFASICIASCNMPDCDNQRAIFNEYSPDDELYKKELARIIDSSFDKTDRDYWIKDYRVVGDREYMDVFIQGENLCAVIPMDITDENKRLKHFKEVKGKSYSGAGLRNLKYTINHTDSTVDFVFNSVGRIVD